jgi:carboxyl-terminal processing protease
MKKWLIVLVGLVIAAIMLAGVFSAGLLVGNYLLPKGEVITQTIGDLPVISDSDPSVAPTRSSETPSTEDVDSETSTIEPDRSEEELTESTPSTIITPTLDIPPPAEGLSDLFVPFWETWDIIHQHYVDQPVDDTNLMEGAIDGMIQVMNVTSPTMNIEIPKIDEYADKSETPEELKELFIPFWESWTLIHAVDNEHLVQGAISGMLDSLGDPHTSYINPEDYYQATKVREGEEEYEGIGAWVDVTKDYLTIVTPFPNSPAEKAGLQPGDKIIAIDGEDMTDVDGELVRQKVIGPSGTTITLTILREGAGTFDVVVTRSSILVPSVEAYMREDDIAYIRLFTFGDKSHEQVREALEMLLSQDPIGLVFDLRYNPGGTVNSAVAIASEFIADGVIFYEVYGDGSKETFESSGSGLATDIPLVVLVNHGTASASEIVSGAIQDYGRAPLVGTTTFGKGSVQYWIPLSNEQGAVRVTIASWITPNERHIHQTGLEPDVQIIGISQMTIDEGFDLDVLEMDPEDIIILGEDEIQTGLDVQLEKAVEILLQQGDN